MSVFSDELRSYIEHTGIKIQTLSKQTAIERTLLHKFISDERTPDDDMLNRIILSLMLTPSQSSRLRKMLMIKRMGPQVYSRNMHVKALFEKFGALNYGRNNISMRFSHSIDGLPDSATVYGNYEIQSVLKALVEIEASNSSGRIRIIAQPEFSFLIDILAAIGPNKPLLTVEHIICMQCAISQKDDGSYNIGCLSAMVPLLVSDFMYKPFVYYDNAQAHINQTSILPYMIITEDGVLNISYDMKYGTFFRSADFITLYSAIYNDIYNKSVSMFNRLGSASEYLEFYQNPSAYSSNCTIFCEPCLAFFITEDILTKYIYEALPDKHVILSMYSKLIDQRFKQLIEKNKYILSCFTEEGLDDFITYGRITDIPSDYYSPIEKEDCYKMLTKMHELTLSGLYQPIIINTNKFRLPRNLVLTASTNGEAASLTYIHPQYGPIVFDFTEQSLILAFSNFIEYLKASDMVLSREETLRVIEDKLIKLDNLIKCN